MDIKIQKFFGKVSVWVGGAEQSGKWVERVWNKTLRNRRYKNVLILGLGCGTVVKIIDKSAKIVGVEFDPVMIDIGKKYFDLEKYANLEIVCEDASKYVKKTKKIFDLILVDLYVGQEFPKEFESDEFLKKLSQIVSKNGTVIFNRLTGKNINFELNNFVDKLSHYLVVSGKEKIDWNWLIYCHSGG